MDVKKESPKKPHIHTLTKELFSKLSLSLFSYPAVAVVSFLLSRSVFLGTSSPFGIAACAAIGAGSYSLPGLVGGIIGYLSVLEQTNSLKYIACMILVFTAHFVFSGTSFTKRKYFTPLSVIIPFLCIDLVFLAADGFPLYGIALSAFEITLATLAACFLSRLVPSVSRNRFQLASGLLVLAIGITSSLSPVILFDAFSLGRALALLLIALCSFSGGTGVGSICGLLLGASVALALGRPEYGLIFGVFGILTASLRRFGKVISLLSSFVLSACICACLDTALIFSHLIEFAAALPFFFFLESSFSKHTHRFFVRSDGHREIHLRRYATERLNCASSAFKSLAGTLSDLHDKKSSTDLDDIRIFFDKTSRTLCKKCSLRSICWERDYQATKDAFTKAGDAIVKNGALTARDFPVYFSSRCLNTESFVNSVNREIFAMRYRYKSDEKLIERRELLRRQYNDIATVFSDLSLDISNNARFDEYAEAEVSNELLRRGILCDAAVYRDSENRINIHICGRDLSVIAKNSDEFLPLFSGACKVPLAEPKYTPSKELDDIVIRELPKLRASFGAATKSRTSGEQNGDSGTLFYPSNGHLALLLSDGMGSGKLAAKESAKSIKLLSELLRGGLSPKDALAALQSALALRLEFTGSFSTLDLFSANLFTGAAEVYKLGGAPTYIKRDKTIRRICASSLPAGVTLGEKYEPDITPLTLEGGDYIIMTSDGIAEGSDDVKLLDFLSNASPASPKALADELLAFSLAHYNKSDDMTVAVIRIENAY